jgi:antitoxin component YwqK of YwqJK toxin-antitoxin module
MTIRLLLAILFFACESSVAQNSIQLKPINAWDSNGRQGFHLDTTKIFKGDKLSIKAVEFVNYKDHKREGPSVIYDQSGNVRVMNFLQDSVVSSMSFYKTAKIRQIWEQKGNELSGFRLFFNKRGKVIVVTREIQSIFQDIYFYFNKRVLKRFLKHHNLVCPNCG